MLRYRWYLLGAFALVLLIWWAFSASRVGPLEACLSDCAGEMPESTGRLTFLDFNMLHGFPRFERLPERVELIAAEIQRLDPDIVCLQEVPWTRRTGSVARLLARQNQMNYAYLPANGNRRAIFFSEGEAILSKFPIQEATFRELAPRPGWFEHRVVLHAAIELPGVDDPRGQVHVFCTHLTKGDTRANQGQSAALQEFVAAYPGGLAFIAGDFNAREDSPQIVQLSRVWIDAFRSAHPAEAGRTCCIEALASQDAPGLKERIDYVFLRLAGMGGTRQDFPAVRGLRIVDSRIVFDRPLASPGAGLAGALWASDHLGLLVEIEYP